MRRILLILSLSSIAGLLAVSAILAVESYATDRVDALLKQQVTRAARIADISWETVRISPLRLGVVLYRTRVRTCLGHRLDISRIILSGRISRRLDLEYVRIRMQGIRFIEIPGYGRDSIPGFPDLYDMTAHMVAEIAYDPAQQHLRVRDLELNGENYGRLRLSLGMDQFRLREVMDLRFDPLIIRQVTLKYRDETLLKRLVAGDSKKILDFRRFMAQAARLEMEVAEQQGDPARAAALSGLQDFFETPGRLTVTLALNRRVALSQILNVRRISGLLDLITCHFTNA